MRATFGTAALTGVMLAGCLAADVGLGGVAGEVGVQVLCGEDAGECPSGEIRVEIGTEAWAVAGPGSATATAAEPVVVRVVDAGSCLTFVEFTVQPDHRYLVRMGEDGHTTAVDLEHERAAFEWGPSMREAPLTGCR